jgi:hypothetical protein
MTLKSIITNKTQNFTVEGFSAFNFKSITKNLTLSKQSKKPNLIKTIWLAQICGVVAGDKF